MPDRNGRARRPSCRASAIHGFRIQGCPPLGLSSGPNVAISRHQHLSTGAPGKSPGPGETQRRRWDSAQYDIYAGQSIFHDRMVPVESYRES